MQLSEYRTYDATGLAELVAKGDVLPTELLETALKGTAATNDALNAVVATFEDEARRFIKEELGEGPFKGVPFVLKDLTAHYAGQPTGAGWPPRKDVKPKKDSELVSRYKKAGLVTFAKTAVPELAMDWTTRSRAHGVTNNPWNTGRTAGTSSGGTAAAVAAGIVPMGHGNDGGGSIRVPSSVCGCFGMKPSRGRNPVAPSGSTWQGMLVEHALTRSVRDSAALLDATAGPYQGQFFNSPAGCNFAAEVGRDPGKLKIGVSTRAPYGAATHADCKAAVAETVKLLESLGHECEPFDINLPQDGWSAFETFILAEYATDMRLEESFIGRKLAQDDFPQMLWDMIDAGNRISAVDVNVATTRLHEVASAVSSTFQTYDVFLSPTLAQPPLPHAAFPASTSMRGHYEFYLSWMPYTHIFNVNGSPAMSVPLVWNAEGLPIGVQFAAAPAAEGLLFRLASQLEVARPWKNRRPQISVA
ncbi:MULTISPECIES: amidase [Rhizobium]|uniref:Amidase n=1 Tax=Rhizobium rhododendri TaxID=2506430 RepID=A0ABY8INF1_9HYPH|nr:MULTISPECIES: amidase [Rhizobium]TQX82225.1 amidase [Rhizobium sp. rho-13.1]TQY05557.1 amidase [Rhizobium sp. rho-1.1]WFS24866.1 amidase [Rhizobium rhododendri]